MVEIRTRMAVRPHGAYAVTVADRLVLAFEGRTRSRGPVTLASGEAAALALPRGTVLRGGDLVVAGDGRVIEVVAPPEPLLHVTCASPEALARAAYHLGNRHVPVQVGEGWLRLAGDHVLETMLGGLGASVTPVEAPFEPEAGAYGAHHCHDNDSGHGGRIHEFAPPAGGKPA